MSNEIINLNERLSRPLSREGALAAVEDYQLPEIAENVRRAAEDIGWLARLAMYVPGSSEEEVPVLPFAVGDDGEPVDFSHNLSKRAIVENIEARLKHLQFEFGELRKRVEQEEKPDSPRDASAA